MKGKRRFFTAPDGAEISYYDAGSGPALLWIHGWGGDSIRLEPTLEALSDEGFRCLSFDQRGCGFTVSVKDLGVPQSARDVKALIEHLGLEDVTVIGYSMGAAVLLSYIEQFGTEHIAKLMIGDMTPKPLNDGDWQYGLYQGWYTPESMERDLYNMEHDYEKFAYYFAYQTLFLHTPEEIRDFRVDSAFIENVHKRADEEGKTLLLEGILMKDPPHMQANRLYWASCDYHDYRDAVDRIDKPVAFCYADPGSLYDPRCAKWMASRVKEGYLFPFMDCTHLASVEKPEEFRQTIVDFARMQR
jgi:pimeloyl-ACP methyl ester carboxylesterase